MSRSLDSTEFVYSDRGYLIVRLMAIIASSLANSVYLRLKRDTVANSVHAINSLFDRLGKIAEWH